VKTHLIIPDPHSAPDEDLTRFTNLGKLIASVKPDTVICIGDWADMPSLCSYDKGTKGFEGRRYKKDIEASCQAQELMFKPIKEAKKKLPRFIMTTGNHDYGRIEKAIEKDPVLDGTISVDDLQYKDYGWETFPFLHPIEVDGVYYSHYFPTGVMGRATSGEHQAYTLLTKQFVSCTQGHTHTRDFAERTCPDGRRVLGLVTGCYIDRVHHYAGEANKMWWSGVVIKRNVSQGFYDFEFISTERIKNEFRS
jgi:hypothetical protein